MNNKKLGTILCLIGGVLMIVGSAIGSVYIYILIYAFAKSHLTGATSTAMGIIITIIIFIAMGGGFSVVIGTILFMRDHEKLGKLLITIRAGMGLIGLIIFFIMLIYTWTVVSTLGSLILATINGSYGFAGVLLTIYGRIKLKD